MPLYNWIQGDSVPASAKAPASLHEKVRRAVCVAASAHAKLNQARGLFDDLGLLPCWLSFRFDSSAHILCADPSVDEGIVVPFHVDCQNDGFDLRALDALPEELQGYQDADAKETRPNDEVFRVVGRESGHAECLLIHAAPELPRAEHEQQAVFHFLQSLHQTITTQTLTQALRLNRFAATFHATPLDEKRASEALLAEAIAVTGAVGGCVWRLRDAGQGVELMAWKGLGAGGKELLEQACAVPIRDWIADPQRHSSRLISAAANDPARDVLPQEFQHGTAILVPLVVRTTPLGLLCLFSPEPYRHTSLDLVLAEAVTALSGNALTSLLQVAQLRAVQESFNRVLAAPQGQEEWLHDLHQHLNEKLGRDIGFLTLQLLNEQTGMVETVVASGRRARPWNLIARHHVDSSDINADIFRRPRVTVIRSGDAHFDSLLFQPFGHISLERLFMPLFAPKGELLAPPILDKHDHIDGPNMNKREWSLQVPKDAIIGTLEIGVDIEAADIDKDAPWFFTPESTNLICQHVWAKQAALEQWRLRTALQTAICAVADVSGAPRAELTYPSAMGEQVVTAGHYRSSPSDLAVPYEQDLAIAGTPWGKVRLWLPGDDHSLETHVVDLLVLEIGHFLSTLRQERATADLNAFLLAVFNAVAWLHRERSPEDFLQMLAATAMHFLLAERITVTTTYQGDKKHFELTKAKPWLDAPTPPPALERIPTGIETHTDLLVTVEFGESQLVPSPIAITQHYLSSNYYPPEYYRNLKSILQNHADRALRTFHDDRRFEDSLKLRAAQVAHAAKSHLAGLADDADLLRLHLASPEAYPNLNPLWQCDTMVRRVEEARDQVLATLNDTGTLARIVLNVRQATESIVASYTTAADAREIDIHVESSVDRLPRIQIAKAEFDIILRNLIENAVKYSWDGRPVRIFAHEQVPNRLCIQNFGEGIPDEYQKLIFSPGFRGVPRRRRPDAGGLGVGLQTAKQVADSLQIDLGFKSEFRGTTAADQLEGRRYLTTFWVTFPSTLVVA